MAFNKKGSIKRTSSGILIGIIGLILAAFGSESGNPWLMRGGIVATTFAIWLITWK